MPQSKKRHHSHHHHQQQQHPAPGNQQQRTKSGRVIKAGIIFFAVLGLLVSYFIAGRDIVWLIAGTLIGAAAGYFFAKQMNNTFSK